MKAWEICNKENVNKLYKNNNGERWKIIFCCKDNYDIEAENGLMHLGELYTIQQIADMDFEEVVDWSKVPVDTKILVKDTIERKWHKRYFAKYEDGVVYTWHNGCTSFTTEETTQWDCAKLYEEGEE